MNPSSKRLLSLSALLALVSLAMPSAFAGNESGGGGGDTRCQEYSNLAGKFASTLLTIGQPKVNEINAVIQVAEVWNIKRKLICVPSHNMDRQARSYPIGAHADYPDRAVTFLDVDQWDKMDSRVKFLLMPHELSVLAGYEVDGEYFISEDMRKVLEKNASIEFGLQFRADDVTRNPDGSYSILYPNINYGGRPYYFNWKSSGLGVCKSLGFSSHTTRKLSRSASVRVRHLVEVDNEGRVITKKDDGIGVVLKLVVCKFPSMGQ